ncbi:esterase/lipase family protein [Archangium gephyra]|uniref:esterase/lipase family protein n=1 Tax=Archangium gephyra TaxID=48 RepID=UPI003B7E874D
MQNHIVLVPGFGGFDALGSLRYYHGVTQVLGPSPLVLHYFPNLPTASVQTRARRLRLWLGDLQERRVIGGKDALHLVGHSTGGLDIRQLLIDYRRREGTQAPGMDVLERIRTVQFISTPQRGTNLARRVRGLGGASRVLTRWMPRMLYETTRALRTGGVSFAGRCLQRMWPPDEGSPDWLDAAIQTMVGFGARRENLERALARASYFETLRWLMHVSTDVAAISDLDPVRAPGAPESPAHRTSPDEERDFLRAKDIHYRSIVTVAKRPAEDARGLFKFVYGLTSRGPTPELGQARSIPWLGESKQGTRMLTPSDNDGIVNSVSMVWPDAESSFLVEADHADVIGHFRYSQPPRQELDAPQRYYQYDLLSSGSNFGQREFEALWGEIASFTGSWRYPRDLARPEEAWVM